MITHLHHEPITAGKYLITPLCRPGTEGVYRATLSVRSGQGSGTSDRVYTFTDPFGSRDAALEHAASQGRAWLADPRAFG